MLCRGVEGWPVGDLRSCPAAPALRVHRTGRSLPPIHACAAVRPGAGWGVLGVFRRRAPRTGRGRGYQSPTPDDHGRQLPAPMDTPSPVSTALEELLVLT